MINSDENSRDRIAAAKLLIEYGCGKPKETIEQTHNINDFNIKDLFKFDNDKNKYKPLGSDSRYFVITGGRGSGKSYSINLFYFAYIRNRTRNIIYSLHFNFCTRFDYS